MLNPSIRGVRREQASVDLRQGQAVESAAAVHQIEKAFEKFPQFRAALVVEWLQAPALQEVP
jgi:hypothetical protein